MNVSSNKIGTLLIHLIPEKYCLVLKKVDHKSTKSGRQKSNYSGVSPQRFRLQRSGWKAWHQQNHFDARTLAKLSYYLLGPTSSFGPDSYRDIYLVMRRMKRKLSKGDSFGMPAVGLCPDIYWDCFRHFGKPWTLAARLGAASASPIYHLQFRLEVINWAIELTMNFCILYEHLYRADEFQIPPQTQML